jgi:hypothetical protein
MEGSMKARLFIATIIITLVTVWFYLPAVMDIWSKKATLNSAYSLGFFLGIVVALLWCAVLYQWNKS